MRYLIIAFLLNTGVLLAQNPNPSLPPAGLPDTTMLEPDTPNPDTIYTFISPRPLLLGARAQAKRNTIGLEVLFSGSGLGIGCQMERVLNTDYKLNWGIFFSGKRASDEIEYYDNYGNSIIYNKINRLYVLPLNIGIQRYINIKDLGKTFRPFVNAMLNPALIWQIPYRSSWFNDLKFSEWHFRFGGGIAVGADFGEINTSLISFKLKYLYIPYGSSGLESIKDLPIKNFGGFFLSLTAGSYY